MLEVIKLSESDIQKNKQEYIRLLSLVNREGVSDIINYLETKTDFFDAPASTKFHGNYRGGLCEHSLAVYSNLFRLIGEFKLKNISSDSTILVALLHDLAKVNFYEQYDKNVKVDGQWVQEKHYKVRDLEDRFVYGSHEQTSLFIVQQFIPLSIEEQVAILSHHGGLGDDNLSLNNVSNVYNTYKLPMYLHIADLIDAFRHE